MTNKDRLSKSTLKVFSHKESRGFISPVRISQDIFPFLLFQNFTRKGKEKHGFIHKKRKRKRNFR